MKELAKKEGSHAVPYVNVSAIAVFLVLLDERFHLAIKQKEIAFYSGAIAWGLAMVIRYGRPIARAFYRKLLIAVGAIFIVLISSSAIASPARIVLDCAQTTEVLDGATNEIETSCARPRLYFDIGIRFGGLTFDMRKPRQVLAGFDAGTGYGFRWLPDFWTLTASFLSIDLFLNAGYLAKEDSPDAVSVSGLAVISLVNFIGIGLGYRWELALGDAPDLHGPIGTVGVATSF